MIPCIDAIAINKKPIPTIQSTIQTMVFWIKKSSDTSGVMRLAIPNEKAKKLTNIEKRRITELSKYDSLILKNFIVHGI